jgi:hypothetical protein
MQCEIKKLLLLKIILKKINLINARGMLIAPDFLIKNLINLQDTIRPGF